MKICSRSIGLQGKLCRKPAEFRYRTTNSYKYVCSECAEWIKNNRNLRHIVKMEAV